MIRCSSLERRSLCPGSLKAEDGLADSPSDVAKSGTKIHNALRLHFSGTIGDQNDIITLCKLDERETIIFKSFAKKVETIIEQHGGAIKIYPEMEMRI